MEQNAFLLACPLCQGSFTIGKNNPSKYIECANKHRFFKNGNIYSFLDSKENDLDLSIKKWGEYYLNLGNKIDQGLKNYIIEDYPFVYKQLFRDCVPNKNLVFLEIGCGPMFFASQIASYVGLVVGIDSSIQALVLAERVLRSRNISNYLLIHGDIKCIPLKDSCVDMLYGGGVLEHFKDTSKAVLEIHRVLRVGGRSFNTVPCLNFGAITYRQLWGNIPNIPIIRQIFEFFHIKVLRARHMRFGYELSFTPHKIKTIHRDVGFTKVAVDHFETRLVFEYIRNELIRKLLVWLATNSPFFWPMIKVEATK